MKIGFLAYSLMALENYWRGLCDEADCWWAVTQPTIYEQLREKNIENVVYEYDEHVTRNDKSHGNKYVSRKPGESERLVAEKISPSLWIADTLNKLNSVPKEAFWVQVFHTLPIKKHFFYPPVLEYDLLLIPGEYHRQEITKRLNLTSRDEERLRTIGWPRVDVFFNGTYDGQRPTIMRSLGLDPDRKTILYAPTWGWGQGNEMLFVRWHEEEIEVFERLCHEISDMDLNFIVKLHPLSFHAANPRLMDIARKYDVLWVTKEVSVFLDDPNPYLWVTDVLISDLSGIIADFLPLDRPIIYIEPDKNLNPWDESDMPRSFRVGHVVKTLEGLLEAIEDSIEHPEAFGIHRQELTSKLFHKLDGGATYRGVKEILAFAGRNGLI